MNVNTENIGTFRTWNRAILNLYWIIIAFIIGSGLITYYFSSRVSSEYAYANPHLLRMSIALISLLLVGELILYYIHRSFDYVLIVIGFMIAIILMIVVGESVKGLHIALEIPMLVSMFYFNSKRLWFAGLLTLFGFMILYVFVADLREIVSPYDFIAIFGMIIGTSVVGHTIRLRGMDLLHSLECAVSSGNELFVDTITLEYTSKQDYLTGLYNHITFHEYLDLLIQQHETNGLPLQLVILDIDNFKQINDKFGHLQGDEVLRKLSALLTASITSEDFAARYGGEEFTLILTGKSPAESLEMIEGIRENIATIDFPELDHQSVTVSIGLTEYVRGLGKDALFKNADALLYQAKHQGKNRTMSDFDKDTTHGYNN